LSEKPFVVCNCAAIVESLFESELFGHVRGAFTGAVEDRIGLFEAANGGTIFFDEIGGGPVTRHSKLLRVLQNHEIQRIGSPGVRRVNVRVIAATNRDLRAMIVKEQFREDLYYRLAMVQVHLPRLADRKEDLPLLERHFLNKYSREFAKEITGISPRAQLILSRHDWPGNVRELENAIGHGCMMTAGDTLDVRDLPEYLQQKLSAPGAPSPLLTLAQVEAQHAQMV